jgi:exo-beta-1,3-glucanase (GH17 family)
MASRNFRSITTHLGLPRSWAPTVTLVVMTCACAPAAPTAPPTGPTTSTGRAAAVERRPFAPQIQGRIARAGISYGPYRVGQRPGGPDPSPTQILEDLQLIAQHWKLVRIYSSRGPAETILRTVRDHDLPLGVMVGAWVAPDAPTDNAAEVAAAIRLAKAYPDQVVAVSVGNETQVAWSGHRVPRATLIEQIEAVRRSVPQPVTTADDYNFWNKPESHDVAEAIDFMVVHAYAMWNGQSLDEAIPWTRDTVTAIASEHPDLPLVLGETGWATAMNPEGDETKHIEAPAGEAEQATFFAAFDAWARREKLTHFYFEAFDEPWKGGDDPRDVEKHWGLYRADRTPKAALAERTP